MTARMPLSRRVASLAILGVCAALSGCGAELPESEIPSLDSAAIRTKLDELRGKPLLVNLWAMWCGPCVKELPDLSAATAAIREAGGEVIALNTELLDPAVDSVDTVRKLPNFVTRRSLEMDVWMWTGGDPLELYQALGTAPTTGIPVTLAINSAGKVVEAHVGQLDQAGFEAMFETASK